MKTVVFDVMHNGKFIMQLRYKYCPAFPINMEEVLTEVVTKRPTLKGKNIELYLTNNILR